MAPNLFCEVVLPFAILGDSAAKLLAVSFVCAMKSRAPLFEASVRFLGPTAFIS